MKEVFLKEQSGYADFAVSHYIAASRWKEKTHLIADLINKLRELPEGEGLEGFFESDRKKLLFGAGVQATWLLFQLSMYQINVEALICTSKDTSKYIHIPDSLPVYDIEGFTLNKDGYDIVLAVSPKHYSKIITKLESAGFRNIYFTEDDFTDNNYATGNNSVSETRMLLTVSLPAKITVKSITIDDFVKENNLPCVDFIKADIEGAERQMLKGAKETLRRFAPKLSLCTYHLPDDPEVMKQLILEANPNYVIVQKTHKLYAYVPK